MTRGRFYVSLDRPCIDTNVNNISKNDHLNHNSQLQKSFLLTTIGILILGLYQLFLIFQIRRDNHGK